MKRSGIPIKGVSFDTKTGTVKKSTKRLSVSARIRQKKSKTVRVAKGTPR